jgi:hypothetical protein
MGLFSRKKPNPKWEAATLRDCLANELEYEVEAGEEYVIVRDAGEMMALIEMVEDDTECVVSFNLDLVPSIAAEIAVELDRLLPTHIDTDQAFVSELITNNNNQEMN